METVDQQFLDLPGLKHLWDRALKTFKLKQDYLGMLKSDIIEGTTQNIVFNNDGDVEKIEHRNLNNLIIRTDTFRFDGNIITETRRLIYGHVLTIVTNTETLVTTTTYTGV